MSTFLNRAFTSPLPLQILALTVVRIVMNTAYRMVYPFLPVFSRSLGVDLEILALILTARSTLGLASPFFASISDQRGRKTGMVLGLLLFSVGMALVLLRPGLAAFGATLLLAALGKYFFDTAMQAYVGDRIPYQNRGRVIAITELSWGTSFILGVPLVGWMIAGWGWTAPFPFLAGLGLLGAVALALLLPSEAAHPALPGGLVRSLLSVATSPLALSGLAMAALASGANEVINIIFGTWMENSFGLQIAALGTASAVIGVAELGGESLVGGLADRLGKPRAVGLGLAANSLAALALPFFGRSLPGALAGLFLFYITFEFTIVSIIPLMTEVLPGARSTFMAANLAGITSGRALAALLAPFVFGFGMAASVGVTALLNLAAFFALITLTKGLGKTVG